MNINKHLYRINVGFLINQPVGTFREFGLEDPEMMLDDDAKATDIKTSVRVSKVQQGILAEVHCTARTELQCMRCLENYTQDLDAEFQEIFYFSNMRGNEDEELFLPETGYMDLDELVREYLVMEIPYAPVCDPECKGLCPICGNNLNKSTCSHPEE